MFVCLSVHPKSETSEIIRSMRHRAWNVEALLLVRLNRQRAVYVSPCLWSWSQSNIWFVSTIFQPRTVRNQFLFAMLRPRALSYIGAYFSTSMGILWPAFGICKGPIECCTGSASRLTFFVRRSAECDHRRPFTDRLSTWQRKPLPRNGRNMKSMRSNKRN